MKQRVLIVDDEPSVLGALEQFLSCETLDVLTVASAEEALVLLSETPVHVVISDQNMPGMKGTELLAKVRELYPDTARILLTGLATLDNVIDAVNRGEIYRFLLKPCSPAELVSAVRQALEHRELIAQGRRMLATLRAQRFLLEGAEARHPGITAREPTEPYIIEELPGDLTTFLAQVNAELALANHEVVS